ncbi:unnamed protein product [Mytilus coruscus]|uniref:Integrase catalytic domain-containing protein n=1 Tax=Mytilus coruscus TaxID=42192 RepID=A0A6J8BYZ8_MYTCO|nr:unnamed protein product [Mytilus coruscus]
MQPYLSCRQFAHPPMNRLIALLKDAGVWKEEYEQEMSTIEEQCEICKRYAKAAPRPVVSLPMVSQYNEKVAMDLKQWNGRYILHMIDMWSRYTVSVFIDRKKTTGVIEKMMNNWIGIFGVMGTILTDNGGEFSSDKNREVASILNVKVYTTAGDSPFQNGLCGRVHYKLPNSNTWTKSTVLSKAGKTTGKNKHWCNVQDDVDEDKKSVDFDKVEWKKVTGDSDMNEIGVNMTNSSYLNDEEIAK